MNSYVSTELRRTVTIRADYLCEYCLIHEEDTFLGCQVDHIISVKHSGSSELSNLAYACTFCNRQKGSDLGSISPETGRLVRFFNPRRDRWSEHFRLNGAEIEPLTEIGEVTVRILGFNHSDRLLERRTLIATDRYPRESALRHIEG